MEILSFKTLPSTQNYLIEQLKEGRLKAPVAVITSEQYSGIGSRDNSWTGGEGNFFASIALEIDRLPEDLPLGSASIYFSFIMKQTLVDFGETIWLKWPNDLIVKSRGWKKLAGILTETGIAGEQVTFAIVGIGINVNVERETLPALDPNATSILRSWLV